MSNQVQIGSYHLRLELHFLICKNSEVPEPNLDDNCVAGKNGRADGVEQVVEGVVPRHNCTHLQNRTQTPCLILDSSSSQESRCALRLYFAA